MRNSGKDGRLRPVGEIFQAGIAPRLGAAALEALRDALQRDDPALVQRETTHPSSNEHPYCEECLGACGVAYGLWKSLCLYNIGDVERRFTKLCCSVDAQMGAGSSTRWLNHYDETPRQEMRAELLPQVVKAIEREREGGRP
jgi:hypothetical protein